MRTTGGVPALVLAVVVGIGLAPTPPAARATAPLAAVDDATPHDVVAARAKTKPVVTKVKPASGPFVGGTVVTVRGKRFVRVTKVLFGTDKGSSVTVKNPRKLTVVAPPHEVGTVAVRVVTKAGGRSKASSQARFTYTGGTTPVTGPPVVAGLSPSSGPTAGGTVVQITGDRFTNTTSVTFGGTPVGYALLSDDLIRVTTPARAAGGVPVVVTTLSGTSAPVTFTYQPPPATGPPVVALVTPPTGPAAGGTVVTISGSSLTGTTGVSFGGTPATSFTVNSDSSITATTPPHALGLVGVTVTTPAGSSTGVGLFLYLI